MMRAPRQLSGHSLEPEVFVSQNVEIKFNKTR